MNDKFDDRPLDVIALDMVEWCKWKRSCHVTATDKDETWLTCPNDNCPSRQKDERHKAFSINNNTANFKCFHCDLQGTGLYGSNGLKAKLGLSDFLPAVSTATAPTPKPQQQLDIVGASNKILMTKDEFAQYAGKWLDSITTYLDKRGIPSTHARGTKAFCLQKGDSFPLLKKPLMTDAICFPIFDTNGDMAYCHIRFIEGGYKYDYGKKALFVTSKTPETSDIIVIAEAIFDALSFGVAGYQAVALLGMELLDQYDKSIFKDKNVVIALDKDAEQKKTGATDAIASKLKGIAKEIFVANMPKEANIKDPNDILAHYDNKKLAELIDKTIKPKEGSEAVDAGDNAEAPEPISEPPTAGIEADTAGAQEAEVAETTPTVVVSDKPVDTAVTPSLLAFPECAWRGIFDTYKQALEGVTEAPEQYHFGVLATISGIIIGRTCYLSNPKPLYINFYTAIVGPSGKSRKTTATDLCMSVLDNVDQNVIVLRGLSSPEGLIGKLQIPSDEELGELPEHEKQRATSVASVADFEGYRCLMFCNEFASLLKKAKNENTSGIIQTLTNLYDCPLTLDNPTRDRPLRAMRPTGAMIALSTTEWLERNLTPEDIFGGFGNRFCFYNYTPTKPIPRPQKPDGVSIETIVGKLIGIRQERKKKQTEYYFDNDAGKIVDEWYFDRWHREYDSDVVAVISERVDTHVRKLALLYAVLENEPTDHTIHADQIETAIQVGKYWEQAALSIFGTFGFTQVTRNEMRVMEALANKPFTKRELHQKVGGRLSATELDKILKSLLSVGRIETFSEKYTDKRGRLKTRQLYKIAEI